MPVFAVGERVMLGVSEDVRPNVPLSKAAGCNARASPDQSGEEFSMRFMKPAMAIAAVCVAMLSLTMATKRKRQGSKGRRSRAYG